MKSMVFRLEKLSASKEDPVKEVLEHLLIEKFSSKSKNVESCFDCFEKESTRFSLTGRRQIEVFKSCLDSSLNNSFIVTQQNLPIDAQWSS